MAIDLTFVRLKSIIGMFYLSHKFRKGLSGRFFIKVMLVFYPGLAYSIQYLGTNYHPFAQKEFFRISNSGFLVLILGGFTVFAIVIPGLLKKKNRRTMGLHNPKAGRDKKASYNADVLQNDALQNQEENVGFKPISQNIGSKIFESVEEAIVITDENSFIINANPAYSKIMGYDMEEIIQSKPNLVKSGLHDQSFYQQMWKSIQETGSWSGEIWDRRKSGEVFPKWLSIISMMNESGKITNYIGIFSDISEQKNMQTKLREISYYDPLTQLPNRVLFRDRLNQELLYSKREDSFCAVLFIDLDHFKYVNDSLGYEIGDLLLIQVAERLKNCFRDTDTVARFESDKFIAIMAGLHNFRSISNTAQGVVESVRRKFVVRGKDVFIGASIGITVFPDGGKDYETLTKNAETAVKKSKDKGRGKYYFFTTEMNEKNRKKIEMNNILKKSVFEKEFFLLYQPKINMVTGEIMGYEALARWNSPVFGMVSPSEFIPIAEENNIIIPIGRWVIQQTFRDLPKIIVSDSQQRIAINLSPNQLHDPDLIKIFEENFTKTGIPVGNLEIEITEGSLMLDPDESKNILKNINAMGITIAIDDFGTGYSSLSYLKKFPLQTLKIDQSFVKDLPKENEDIAIIRSIITLANSLGMNTVAEGVETSEQADFLLSNGCFVAQGYLYSKPLGVSDLVGFLEKYRV